MNHEITNWTNFITAGNAVFTVRNDNTGRRFTFKVKKVENKELWFVSVLAGSDNNSSYTYAET